MGLLDQGFVRRTLPLRFGQRLLRLLLHLHHALRQVEDAGGGNEAEVAVTTHHDDMSVALVGGQLQEELEQTLGRFLAQIEEVPSQACPEGRIASELRGVQKRRRGSF